MPVFETGAFNHSATLPINEENYTTFSFISILTLIYGW